MDFIKKNWVFLLIGLLGYRWYIGKQAGVPFDWNLKQYGLWTPGALATLYWYNRDAGGNITYDFTGDGSTIKSTIGV